MVEKLIVTLVLDCHFSLQFSKACAIQRYSEAHLRISISILILSFHVGLVFLHRALRISIPTDVLYAFTILVMLYSRRVLDLVRVPDRQLFQ